MKPSVSTTCRILPRSMPSTSTLMLPSGSFRLCTMLTMVPTWKMSPALGSSIEASCWVARNIFLSLARASSSARTLDSRPTTNGVIMYGKMTTSRMGIMGNFLLSNFSLGFDNSVSRLWSRLACRFLDHGQRDVPLLHHLASHFKFFNLLLAGQTIHQFQHEFFQNHAQAAGADFARHGLAGNRPVRVVAELQPHVLEFEQTLVLFHNCVLGARQNLHQRVFVQLLEHSHNWEAPDKLGDQSKLDQVFRLRFRDEFKVSQRGYARFGLRIFSHAEAESLLADAPSNDFLQADEGAAANEEDVRGIDGREFLMRMLAATLRRHVRNRPFQNLEQRLLHAFARHVARDRGVLVLASDLVDFVDVDDTGLGAAHIAFGRLQKFKNDVLDVLADVTGLGQRGRVHDREGHIEHAGERLRQQRLAGSGRPDQQNIRLGQFHAVAGALAVHVNAFVMVIDGDRQLLLGLLLPDDVFVEEGLHFERLGQLVGDGSRRSRGAVVFEDRVADRHALVADVCPGIVARRRNQFRNRVLRLVAERTAQHLFRARSVFHSVLLLLWWPSRGWLPSPGTRQAASLHYVMNCRSYLYRVL